MYSAKLINSLRQKKIRQKRHITLIEGPKFIEDLITHDINPSEIHYSERFANTNPLLLKKIRSQTIPLYKKSNRDFKKIADTVNNQGILGIIPIPRGSLDPLQTLDEAGILYLDRIQDPGNLGTLVRTALAAGIKGLLINSGCADPFSPKVIRASAGAVFLLPIVQSADDQVLLKLIKQRHFKLLLSAAKGETNIFDFNVPKKFCLILGNESAGIHPAIARAGEHSLVIPMNHGMESLNVAVSGGILMFMLCKGGSAAIPK